MANKSKRSSGLFNLAEDLAAAKETKKRFNKLCQRLVIPTKEPDYLRWIRVGMMLAYDQPEFTEPLRSRGRPRLEKGAAIDEEILRKVADLMSSAGLDFKRALDEVLKSSDLVPADRTTHKKRLRRLQERKREAMTKRIAKALTAPGRKIRPL